MIYCNNPLNIRHSNRFRWVNEISPRNGFCQFTSINYGIRAAYYLLSRSYRSAGANTIKEKITRWAPPSENPTDAYIMHVCEWNKWSPEYKPATQLDYAKLIHAMWFFEQGKWPELTERQIRDIIESFDLK